MRVTLIYPLLSRERSRIDENKQYWPPLGLAYIAAVLREKGHDVQILDRDHIMRKNDFDFKRIDDVTLELIENYHTDIAGFSATTPNISDVKDFSQKLKKKAPKITTILGGPHCIDEPDDTLELCSGIDILVRGEGEMTMLDIANGLEQERIDGLTYRKSNGMIVSNPERPLIESLDSLPYPAWDMLDMDFYTRPSRFISRNLSLRTTHIFTARGCPYNCYYCAGPLMGRRKVRYHSPERVVSEIEYLIKKYGIEAVYFAEDMFLSSKKRALEMAHLFMERGIHKRIAWMAQISPNAADEELLSTVKKAGCVHVEYGFESGSQRILELMNKKTNVEHNKKLSFLTRKNGLRFQGNFIVGYPGETEEDFNKTIAFIRETKPNNISLNLFMPLPGTEIYKRLKEEGKKLPDWDNIGNPETPSINYADMPEGRFEELFFRAKLRIVLPINLMHFVKDNIRHPVRLLYIFSTQFRSVLSRMLKAVRELRRMGKKNEDKTKVLFVAYHAASDPLMDSQGFSYIKKLAQKGIRYCFLTYETRKSIKASGNTLRESGIPHKWKYLYYHQKPRLLATIFDIARGMFSVAHIIRKNKIDIVHARGVIPGLVSFLPAKIFRAKLFFDTRGLLADKYVGGGLLDKNSLSYRLLRKGENVVLKESDFFTVETHKHAEIMKSVRNGIDKKMDVIPCCVDTDKFDYRKYIHSTDKNITTNLVYLGKIGTWYLIEEMFEFFKVMSQKIQNAHFTFLTQEDAEYLYSLAEKKGIEKSTVTVHRPERAFIPELLAKSQAGIFFINPYKRYNSSPTKYAEFLACGIPVIHNLGIGDTDTITEKEKVGVVVKEFTSEEYEQAVENFISLMKEGGVLCTRCRETAEKHFSLDQGVNKYFKIYQELL